MGSLADGLIVGDILLLGWNDSSQSLKCTELPKGTGTDITWNELPDNLEMSRADTAFDRRDTYPGVPNCECVR